MKDTFTFSMDAYMLYEVKKPIKSKVDLVKLLIHTIKYVTTMPVSPSLSSSSNLLIISVKKMKRIIYSLSDKIFSFSCPFNVDFKKNQGYLSFSSSFTRKSIDSRLTSFLLAIFNKEETFEGNIKTINDKISDEIVDNSWTEIEGIDELIRYLMMFEPGYLRYDRDEKNMKGKVHPEFHIDVYYSSHNKMKLGLDSSINYRWFLELLDVTKDCKYINCKNKYK